MKFKEGKAVDSLDLYLAFLLILPIYLWWNRLGVIIENPKILPELAHLRKSFWRCTLIKVVLVSIVFYILIHPLLCSLIIHGPVCWYAYAVYQWGTVGPLEVLMGLLPSVPFNKLFLILISVMVSLDSARRKSERMLSITWLEKLTTKDSFVSTGYIYFIPYFPVDYISTGIYSRFFPS